MESKNFVSLRFNFIQNLTNMEAVAVIDHPAVDAPSFPTEEIKTGETVTIANPIYDVVFKYLMEDNDIAKLIVSTIIGEEVVWLDPKPQEYTAEKVDVDGKGTIITVYRLDFSAKIKVGNGFKLVLIELQKAKLPTDIARFRGYLGDQYSKEYKTITEKKGDTDESDTEVDVADKENVDPENIQIYCIYFLGKNIGIKNIPVVEVTPLARDAATKKVIEQKNGFLEALHHRSWIIQISYLREPRRTKLETLLAVFDQNYCTVDAHLLAVREDYFPKKYHRIIRRLKMAASDAEIRKQMVQEDKIIRYLQKCVREGVREGVREEIEKKDKIITELTQDLAQKDQDLAQKDIDTVINAKKAGLPVETIAEIAGLTPQEVIKIIENQMK